MQEPESILKFESEPLRHHDVAQMWSGFHWQYHNIFSLKHETEFGGYLATKRSRHYLSLDRSFSSFWMFTFNFKKHLKISKSWFYHSRILPACHIWRNEMNRNEICGFLGLKAGSVPVITAPAGWKMNRHEVNPPQYPVKSLKQGISVILVTSEKRNITRGFGGDWRFTWSAASRKQSSMEGLWAAAPPPHF